MERKILIVVAAFLLLPASARAEETEAKKINWQNIKLGIFLLLPAHFLETAIHEGSHAIAAKASGGNVTEFNILPSNDDGHFYMGYTKISWPHPPTNKERALVLVSPKIANIFLFSASEIIFRTGIIDNSSQSAVVLFIFGELAPWVDFTAGIIHSTDMTRFESATGLRASFTRTIGAMISFAGFYFLFERAKKVFLTSWREREKPSAWIHFNLIADRNLTGGAIKGRF